MEQRSPEWFAAKVGKIGGSRAGPVGERLKNGEPASGMKTVIKQLVYERIAGTNYTIPITWDMQRGMDHEDDARNLYMAKTGRLVTEAGWLDHPGLDGLGCSPDGLVDDDGGIEIKGPRLENHLETAESAEIPKQYIDQMTLICAVTGRKWCDFVSYSPEAPSEPRDYRLFVRRFYPTEDDIARVERNCVEALQQVEAKLQTLERRDFIE